MTTKLFLKWSEEIFFPELTKRRTKENYHGPAFLLLDGLSSHHCDRFFELCEEHNVVVKFLVPHSSDQCQPLDLVTFAVVKKEFTKKGFERFNSAQTVQVIKMLTAWEKATARSLVTSAFRRAGFIQYFSDDVMYVKIDISKADKVRNWAPDQELPIAFEETRRKRIEQ